jgi:hypothetical protein
MVVSEYLNLLLYDPMLIGRELAFVIEMHNVLCEAGNKYKLFPPTNALFIKI